MNEFYIDDSRLIYKIASDGISNETRKFASIDNIKSKFKELSKEFVPSIFSSEDGSVIDPRDLGITNAASCMAYDIYKIAQDDVVERLINIANTLSKNHKDLSDFLSVVIKFAANQNNYHITYDSIVSKLNPEQAKLFKEIYKEESEKAKQIKISERAVLLSTISKTGVQIE